MIWPVANFHVGFQPREKAGFPAGFRASKLALNSAYVGVDSCQIMMMDQQSEVNVLAIKKVGLYGPH